MQTFPRRSRATCLLLGALVLAPAFVLVSPAAEAAPTQVFFDGMEGNPFQWMPGSRVCNDPRAYSGCYLVTNYIANTATRVVTVPMGDVTHVQFMANVDPCHWTGGVKDEMGMEIHLSGGDLLKVYTSRNSLDHGNCGATLVSGSFSAAGCHLGMSWSRAWYAVDVYVDNARDVAWVECAGQASPEVPVTPASRSIVKFNAFFNRLTSESYRAWYDNLLVENSHLPPAQPGAPVAAAGPNAGEITLQWTEGVEDRALPPTSFHIFRTGGGSGVSQIATVPGSELTYVDRGLPPATLFSYYVVAENEMGTSPESSIASARTFSPPGAPSAPGATAGPNNGEITVTWGASPSVPLPVLHYKVYRSASSGGSYEHVASPTATSHTDRGLANGATYYYRVSAVSDAGEGPMSEEAFATTFEPPSPPDNLQATPFPARVLLTWDEADGHSPARPVTEYVVHLLDAGMAPRGTQRVPAGQTWFIDQNLEAGTTYHYQVSAINSVGEGPRSVIVGATTPGQETVTLGAQPVGDAQTVPGQSTPPVNDTKVGHPAIPLPATCTLPVCAERTDLPGGGDIYSPEVPVPFLCVPPEPLDVVCLGGTSIPARKLVTLPQKSLPSVCSVASAICLPATTLPATTLATVPGQPAIPVTSDLVAGFSLHDVAFKATPNAGKVGHIGPIYANVTIPDVGTIPVVICESESPLCYGPIPPQTSFTAKLTIQVAYGNTVVKETVPVEGRT